ncbi:MAG: hypothetical protein GTO51_09470 [Candidatus Latescibacteria bacterium]|nr:hypothetical protein [Candidatus Latescibacterota bacterium]NIM66200.1 hypothetical protein [Candidatus Latescibacterota bacterium]NIO02721.1 hypothetical protein [Candidatus Latescibacterota bacterium]NIT38080.1 hypothetical protein [Candidatus Latescibacterota bacterium]
MRLSYESLLRGDVEAAELFGPFGNAARRNSEIRLLYDTAEEWRELTCTWPMHHALASYTDTLERDPSLPRRIIDILTASAGYGQEHLEELQGLFVKEHGGDLQELQKRVNGSKLKELYSWSLTAEDKKCIQTVLDLSAEFGFVGKRYTVEDITYC